MSGAGARSTTDKTRARALEFYARPSAMTAVGRHSALVDELPSDIDELVRITQGWIVYDAVASEFYGYELSEERQRAIHIRRVEEMLDGILELDPRPLSTARAPDRRLAGRCDHYARLLVAVLRAQGVPARVRCGFAAYVNPGWFEDHMVYERWSADEQRWVSSTRSSTRSSASG